MPVFERGAEADESEVYDFLVAYERDLAAGRPQGLALYLARFPGSEEAIAREYFALRDASSSVAGDAPGPDATDVGPYVLIEELGRGGQGSVWLAEDRRIARRVALKMLPPSYVALSSERRERMRREAALVSRLDHPGICPVYEAEVDGERPYIAMRYIAGETLAARIRRARVEGRFDAPLSPAPRARPGLHALLRYFERAARALHAAHDAGVLHRDVKPGNLMVDERGEPVVVDFGQARDEHFVGAALTLSGEVFGTPAYMAPEQVEGRAVDRRVDVWGLGASLYEALTLRSPMQRDNVPRTLAAIRDEPVPKPSTRDRSIPAEVDVVVATALEKDPARRYASALELAEDLRRIREYEPIRARPAGPLLRLRRWMRRYPALATALAAVFVSLAVGLAWSQHLLARERDALRHAVGRHLAVRAGTLLEEDPSAGLVLSIDAVERAPTYGTRSAMYAALDACRLRSQYYVGDASLITDLVPAPGSTEAVTVQSDGSLRTFELESGRELRRVQLAGSMISALRIDFEHGLALTATQTGEVALWSWPELEPRAAFESEGGAPLLLELDAPRGRLVVVTPGGFAVHGLDGRVSRAERWPGRTAARAAFARGAARLAVAARSPGETLSFLAVHELDAQVPARELRVGTAPIAALEVDPRGEWLACGDEAGSLRCFALASGELAFTTELDAPVTSTRWSPDGERLVVTTGGRWRAGAWLFDRACSTRVTLAERAPRALVDAAFSPDSLQLVTCGEDRTIRTYAARGGRALGEGLALMLPSQVTYSPDGRRIVSRSQGNTAYVWYARGLPELYALRGHAGPVRWGEFDPSGELSITASDDGSARVWRTPRDESSEAGGETVCVLAGNEGPLSRAHFVGRGERALTLAADGTLRCWHLPSGAPDGAPDALGAAPKDVDRSSDGARFVVVTSDGVAHLRALDGVAPTRIAAAVACARFTPDGAELIAACDDGRLRRYRARDGELVAEHPLQGVRAGSYRVLGMALRPDGRELCVAGDDARLQFLDPASGTRTQAELKRVFEVASLSWSPTGGQLLAIGLSGSGAYRLLDLAPRPLRRHEFNHRDDLTCGAYCPEGALGLTASHDGTVFVFETATGMPVSQLELHSAAVLRASFSPAGGPLRVLTTSADGTARVWPVDPLPSARRRKPRELAEWELAREQRLAEPLPYE